jgi:uncharacterized protein YaiL (DUF2058 family)
MRVEGMAGSLQDQLVKAGLATEQQRRQTTSKKRKQKRAGAPAADAAEREQAARAAAEKRKRDQELNRKRDAEAKRKAEQIALWQMVRDHRVTRSGGDTAYNFTDGKALKRLYLSAAQHRDLVAGALAIVRHDDFYELVPGAIAEQLAAADPALVLVHNQPEGDGDDDEYADFKVPDDLMW